MATNLLISENFPPRTGGSGRWFWEIYRRLPREQVVVADSHNTERILLDEWHLAAERVRVLYPGVDTERFVPAPRDYAVRGRLGWGERRVVLTVGRLQKRKGHDMMIRALPALRRAVP